MFRVVKDAKHLKAGGFPSPADDFVQPDLDLNKLILKHPSATFFMQVESQDYKKFGVYPGDLLVVDRSISPKPGKAIIVTQQGEFKLLRASIELAKTAHTFWGTVTLQIRKLK